MSDFEVKVTEAATVSLLPRDEHRAIPQSLITQLLAEAIDSTRYSGAVIDSVVDEFFSSRAIRLPIGHTTAMISRNIMANVAADQVYDSEFYQASRASAKVLRISFGPGPIQASGWLRGQRVVAGNERFTLTGNPCPRCEINPEAYGIGGGTRCIDRSVCRWWDCVS